jgi:hypothetical protein
MPQLVEEQNLLMEDIMSRRPTAEAHDQAVEKDNSVGLEAGAKAALHDVLEDLCGVSPMASLRQMSTS